jgi:uncharacterized membrane protein
MRTMSERCKATAKRHIKLPLPVKAGLVSSAASIAGSSLLLTSYMAVVPGSSIHTLRDFVSGAVAFAYFGAPLAGFYGFLAGTVGAAWLTRRSAAYCGSTRLLMTIATALVLSSVLPFVLWFIACAVLRDCSPDRDFALTWGLFAATGLAASLLSLLVFRRTLSD